MRDLLVCLILVLPGALSGQSSNVLSESRITFSVDNMKINTVRGSMEAIEGQAVFNPMQPEQSTFDVHVPVKSLSTGISKRDKDLMKEAFFHAEKYPFIHVRSEAVDHAAANGVYHFTGFLTIKDVEKELACSFTALQEGAKWILTGSFEINRKEFGIGESYSSFTIDETVAIEVKLVCSAN